MQRTWLKVEIWRLVLIVLWFGMVGAISFIEAPLKFQAPGITIPLGLGIGRLVFAALNVAEAAIFIAYTVLAFFPAAFRLTKNRLYVWGALALLLIFKLAVVRPPLNARTDLVLAGADPGQSPWHYIYIACDVLVMILLLVAAVQSARTMLAHAASTEQPANR